MNLYQPTITGSLSISGSINLSGSISIAGGGTISGTASLATTASYAVVATSASHAVTASSADSFLVRNTLTAQTLVVQTITSSVVYSSGSNVFGNSPDFNTQVFTGSVQANGTNGHYFLGNVGINTSDVSSFPGLSLIVSGTIGLAVGGGAAALVNRDGSGNTSFYGSTGDIKFTDVTLTSNYLTIKNAGNVGIGTADPAFKLDVNGTGRFNGTQNTIITTDSNNSGGYTAHQINFNGSGKALFGFGTYLTTDGGIAIRTIGSTPFTIAIGSAVPNFTIGSTGAATFSSSVTATSGKFASANGTTYAATPQLRIDGNGVNNSYAQIVFTDSALSDGKISYFPAAAAENRFFSISPRQVESDFVIRGGNVGIGTSSPVSILSLGKAGGGQYISAINTTTGYDIGYVQFNSDNITINPQGGASGNDSYIRLLTAATERMRITSGGYTKMSNDGSYYGSTGTYHELRNNVNAASVWITNTKTSGTEELTRIRFTAFAPNNASNWFIYADDSSAARFYVRSDGGIGNFQGNNVNLSDERTKKDIIPLESYWDKFKAIEIVKFKYKDQTHDDFNIGVIAQQVEQVAPEFVDVDGWDNKPKLDEDGNEIVSNEEPLKSVYTADLHHATIKVLQEAMAKIEEQQAQMNSLKAEFDEYKTTHP